MSSIAVLAPVDITFGLLKGQKGKVVAYDSLEKEVWIELDEYTMVVMNPDHIDQSKYLSSEMEEK